MIKPIETSQKLIAVQGSLCQLGNHLFNLGGDYVTASEIRIVENLAENPLCEQVLDEHALDSLFRKIGIDGLAAKGIEILEDADEGRVLAALFVDAFLNGCGKFGDAVGELLDRLLPLLNSRRLVVEELGYGLNEALRLGDVLVQYAHLSLVEDDAPRGLEKDVLARIAAVEL